MSYTFELGCSDCKQCLWIGQGSSLERLCIYTAPPHASNLAEFFKSHKGHHLHFFETQERPDDYIEIDADEVSNEIQENV